MSDYSQLLSENKALKEEVERLKLLVPKVSPTPAKVEAKVVEAKGYGRRVRSQSLTLVGEYEEILTHAESIWLIIIFGSLLIIGIGAAWRM